MLSKFRKIMPVSARAFSNLAKKQEHSLVEKTGQQFSKNRLVDFGELPRGEIPIELEYAPKSSHTKLDNGAQIFAEEYPGWLTTMSIYIRAGSRFETLERSGAAHLLWKSLFGGSSDKSGAELQSEFAKLGARLEITADRELIGYHIQTPATHSAEAFKLLCRQVLTPSLSENVVEAQKESVRQDILNVSRDQHAQTIEMLYYTSFRDHMVGQPLYGNKDIIQNLTKQDLQDHIDATYAGKNAFAIFSGDLKAYEQLKSTAEEHLGALPQETRTPTPNLDKPVTTTSSMAVRDDEMANVNAAVGYPGPGMAHPEYFKYKIFQEILGNYNSAENGSVHLNHGGLCYNYLHRYLGIWPGVGLEITQHHPYSDFSLFTAFLHGNELYTKQLIALVPYILGQASRNLNMVEVFRARARLFNKLLGRKSDVHNHENIARELANFHRRVDRCEAAKRYSALSCDSLLKKFAFDYFYDADISYTVWGNIHHFSGSAYYDQFIGKAVKGSYLGIA